MNHVERSAAPAVVGVRAGKWGRALAVVACLVGGCGQREADSRDDAAGAVVDTEPVDAHESALVAFDLVEQLKTWGDVIPPRPPGQQNAALWNLEGVIPPQCYTRTEGTFNPCFVCHQNRRPGRENRMFDKELQREYSFSDFGLTNRWLNLFEDRSERVEAISDQDIDAYIHVDNYSELAGRLRDASFPGWIPDLENLEAGAAAFDDEGFARDGSWWVAFSYKPLPSTFWPTNGSTDDVMIRLPAKFYTDANGKLSRDVYKANLAILEAAIKLRDDIGSLPFDERVVGKDLDGDGALGLANRVVRPTRYVGAAADTPVVPSLYPRDTEFLHTVRYVGIDDSGNVYAPPRMKEVRYMLKKQFFTAATLGTLYDQEFQDKYEGNLPNYPSVGQNGLNNKMGWWINGFIEGYDGRLRWTTYEEKFFCMGCHNTIGSTVDKTISFPRKVDGAAGWKYIDLKGMPDAPSEDAANSDGEFLTYMERVGGGTEFRSNPEMLRKWYREDGAVNREAVLAAADVHELIVPSRERARTLNKAYKVIVEDQDFIFGRDATVTPPVNVFDVVDPETAPTLPRDRRFDWNIVVNWGAAPPPPPPPDCDAGEIRCGGRCVDPNSDEANCGGCGRSCPASSSCQAGTCSCPGGRIACGGQCIDVTSDPSNCGQCGNACTLPGSVCAAGACTCPVGTVSCGGGCVDVASDPSNCGACGNECTAGRTCQAGACDCAGGLVECGRRCVDLADDPTHCGSCGFACDSGEGCSGGFCVPDPGGPSCEELGSVNAALASEAASLRGDVERLGAELQVCLSGS